MDQAPFVECSFLPDALWHDPEDFDVLPEGGHREVVVEVFGAHNLSAILNVKVAWTLQH